MRSERHLARVSHASGEGAAPPPVSGVRRAGRGTRAGAAARPRILIVDDDADVREALRDMLDLEDVFDIEVAGSIAESRAVLARWTPDIALIDIKLGTESGITLIPLIKAAGEGIVCIVMTAYHASSHAVDALRSGADDFLYKPLDPAGLLRTLQRAVEQRRLEHEKEESEQRFRAIFDQSFQLLFVLEPDGTVTEVNETALRLGGFEREWVVGKPFWRLPWWADRHESEALLRAAVGEAAGGRAVRHEVRIDREPAPALMLDLSLKPLVDGSGKVRMLIAEARDVSEQKAAAEQLRLGAQVFEAAAEGIVVADPSGRILDVNPGFVAMTGFARAEILGRGPHLLAPELRAPRTERAIRHAIARGGRWLGELTLVRKSGEEAPVRASITAVRDTAGAVASFVALASDLSDLRSTEERLAYVAQHDALTGLPNRIVLMDRLRVAAASADSRGRQLALLLVDIDRFRRFNDAFGHRAGDELLQSIARRLEEIVRREDTLARLGSDEFVILLNEIEGTGVAREFAERIVSSTEEPFPSVDRSARVALSVGIAIYPDDAPDAETLLTHAVTAMSTAKQDPLSDFRFYDAGIHERTRARTRIELALREALHREQLHLHFQPKWAIDSGDVVGVEALLRWTHPELGQVSPGDFIPIAEETDLIVAIGEHVLRAACREARRWQSPSEAAIPVSVNLSSRQFRHGELAERVETILDECDLDPSLLELELTEGTLMDDAPRSIAVLQRLKALGVRFSIDDFGTGYSSLSQLKRLPVDTVKIDRSFLSEFDEARGDATIVSAMVSMGRSLGLHVIAEGVETDEQLEMLRDQGCHEVQGFLLSPPVPVQDLDEALSSTPAALRRHA